MLILNIGKLFHTNEKKKIICIWEREWDWCVYTIFIVTPRVFIELLLRFFSLSPNCKQRIPTFMVIDLNAAGSRFSALIKMFALFARFRQCSLVWAIEFTIFEFLVARRASNSQRRNICTASENHYLTGIVKTQSDKKTIKERTFLYNTSVTNGICALKWRSKHPTVERKKKVEMKKECSKQAFQLENIAWDKHNRSSIDIFENGKLSNGNDGVGH